MSIQKFIGWRAVAKSCREEPMYRSTWVNIWSFDSIFMVLWCLLFTFTEWYAYSCFIFFVMNLFQCCVMYDFMLNVWSLREEKNEFQLFLILRVPTRSAVKCPQGVHWKVSEFYLRNLRRDTVVLIPVEV